MTWAWRATGSKLLRSTVPDGKEPGVGAQRTRAAMQTATRARIGDRPCPMGDARGAREWVP